MNNVPALRFKTFTDAWEQRKLGNVAQITMGQSPDGRTYSDVPSTYVLIQGNADLVDGYVTPKIWTTQVTKQCFAGDLIMSVRAPAGAMGKTMFDGVIGRGVASIKGNEFLYQILVKMDSNGYWKSLSCGSTFESLNSNDIKEAIIKVPNNQEQEKIGGLFLSLDSLITLHQRKCDVLKNYKKSLLSKMFPNNGNLIPDIRFKGFTDAWEQSKLGNIGFCKSGIGFPDKEQGGFEGTPFFKVSDMNNIGNERVMITSNNYVSDMQISQYKWSKTHAPSVFFAKVGAAVMLDRKRLVLSDFLSDNNTMAYCFDISKLDTDFVYSLFMNIRLPSLVQVGALPSYGANQVESIEVNIPRMYEQEKIGRLFKDLDSLITLHQHKVDSLKNLKKALLQVMFVS